MNKETKVFATTEEEIDVKKASPTLTYKVKTVLLSQEEIDDSHTIKTEFGMNVKLYPPTNGSIYLTKPVVVNQEVEASYFEKLDDCYLFYAEERENARSYTPGRGYQIDIKNRLIASFPVKGTVIVVKK